MNDFPPVFIFASGAGSRFHNDIQAERIKPVLGVNEDMLRVLDVFPKTMAPIGGVPLIEHVVNIFNSQGAEKFLVVTDSDNSVKSHFKDKRFEGVSIDFLDGKKDVRRIDHLRNARDKLGGLFFTAMADTLCDVDLAAMIQHQKKSDALMISAVSPQAIKNYSGVSLMQAEILSEESEQQVISTLGITDSKQKVLPLLIQLHSQTLPVSSVINVNNLREWLTASKLWDDGKAFWPGAYSVKIPGKSPRRDLSDIAENVPFPNQLPKTNNDQSKGVRRQ